MAKQVVKLQTVLMKLQTAFGTMNTDLNSTDVVYAGSPQIELEPEASPVETIGAGFSTPQVVIGPYGATFKCSFPLRYGGAQDSAGDWAKAMQAMGWKQTLNTHVATLTPTNKQSEWKDATVNGYSGNLDSSGSNLSLLGNLLGGGKLTLDFTKGTAMLEAEFKGYFSAAPAAGTQPTITRTEIAISPLRGATISILGDTDYVPLQIVFDFGQAQDSTVAPAQTHGKGVTLITDRVIKWTAKVYKDLPSVSDPVAALLAGTKGAISVVWGAAPQAFTVSVTAAVLENVKNSEQNGVETQDLSGYVDGNAMTIAVNTTTA